MFGRPIGQNQAIQHPLAACWMELEAANLMAFKAASLYDAGQPCGVEANAAKYLGGEAGFKACETAVMTHGGMGYAKEFHVERYLREVADRAHRAGQPADDPELHRRAGAGAAEVLLTGLRCAALARDGVRLRPAPGRGGAAGGCGRARRPAGTSPATAGSSVAMLAVGHALPDLVHAEQRNAEIAAHVSVRPSGLTVILAW